MSPDPEYSWPRVILLADMNAFFASVEQVNRRYGSMTLAAARLLNRSSMPDVISPAWKPQGHRKTV